MQTAVCLLISFICLGSLAISSVGLFLPMDDHPIWDAFNPHRTLWSASAAFACVVFFALAVTLIDDSHDESSFYDFSLYPFACCLALAALAPPLTLYGYITALRVTVTLMAVVLWVLFHCVVMLFGWGILTLGVALLALQSSWVAYHMIWHVSLHRASEPYLL